MRKLDSLTAVCSATPECALRVRRVKHPFSIGGKVEPFRGSSGKIRHKLAGGRIVTHQFPTFLLANGKEPLAVGAWRRCQEIHGSDGQLHRLGRSVAEKTALFGAGPNVGCSLARGLEYEILPVRCPEATAGLGPPG